MVSRELVIDKAQDARDAILVLAEAAVKAAEMAEADVIHGPRPCLCHRGEGGVKLRPLAEHETEPKWHIEVDGEAVGVSKKARKDILEALDAVAREDVPEKEKEAPVIEFEDEKTIYAVRYCLGRVSAGALGFLGDVKGRAPALSDQVRRVLVRDIREWLRLDQLQMATRDWEDRDARRAAGRLLDALEGAGADA